MIDRYPRPNISFQGTAGKLRLPVRAGLRPPPAPELKRHFPPQWSHFLFGIKEPLIFRRNGAPVASGMKSGCVSLMAKRLTAQGWI